MKFPIEWAIRELSTMILKFFKKKIFNGEGFSKNEVPFAKFQPIFNRKTVLNSQKIGESSFDQATELRWPCFFPIMSLRPLITAEQY